MLFFSTGFFLVLFIVGSHTTEIIENIASNAPTIAEAAVTGASIAKSFQISLGGIMAYIFLPFLWLSSLIISGHVCGLSLLKDAPSLQIRRWLVQQMFICYCGLVLIPAYYIGMGHLLVYFVDIENTMHYIITGSNCFFATVGVGYIFWVRPHYRKIKEQAILPDFEMDYQKLERNIYRGFGLLLLLIVGAFSWFFLFDLLGHLKLTIKNDVSEKNMFLISSFSIAAVAILGVHISMFSLFKKFLKTCQNGTVITEASRYIKNNLPQRHTTRLTQELGYIFFFALIAIYPDLSHLIFFYRRVLISYLGIAVIVIWWTIVLRQNMKTPENRWHNIWGTFLIQFLAMYLLRTTLYGD